MRQLPELPVWEKSVINTQQFMGLNRGLSIADGEMADMLNMSSDNFPVLSTRKKRGVPELRYESMMPTVLSGKVDGMLGTDRLIVCHNGQVYMDGEKVPLTLLTAEGMREKKLVSMGAYICIWPDKVYFNVNNPHDCGPMGSAWSGTQSEAIGIALGKRDGSRYDMSKIPVGLTAPENPENGDMWIDTSGDGHALRQYSTAQNEWVSASTTYLCIYGAGIGKGIKNGDSVYISGVRPSENGSSGTQTYNVNNIEVPSTYKVNNGVPDTPLIGGTTVKVDLPDVPAGASIRSVTLRMTAKNFHGAYHTRCDINGQTFTPTIDGANVTLNLENHPKVNTGTLSLMVMYQTRNDYRDHTGQNGTYGDVLVLSNVTVTVDWDVVADGDATYKELQRLNGVNIVYGVGENYLVVAGILDKELLLANTLTVEKRIPDLDYVCESGNRIWGCVHHTTDGTVVNELRSCALGDFTNWEKYQGTAADSYAATMGSDGIFTGAVAYQGQPIFFKENFIHKVSGTVPANFAVNTIEGRGVQDGSWKSLAVVNETLLYKARNDIMAFEGAMPYSVSQKLGTEHYTNAVAGGYRDKYYINMQDEKKVHHTYVLDVAKGLWHQEDLKQITHMENDGEDLVLAVKEGNSTSLLTVDAKEPQEGLFDWSVTFGILGFQSEQQKYLSRYNIRAQMSAGSHMKVEMQYDSDGKWVHMGTMKSVRLQTLLLPIIPRRCDHCQLRISGKGTINIYSVAREYENGGDG